MAEEAILDAGTDVGADLDIDNGADGGQDDGSQGEGGEQGQQQQGDGQQQGGDGQALQGKELRQALRNSLAEIRGKNPSVAREFKEAVYARDELRREFPGGLQEAREIRDTLNGISAVDSTTGTELKGREALDLIQKESAYLQQLDQHFSSANPALWDQLVEAQPESFIRLMPSAIEKLEQLAPDAFASLIANRMLADMAQEGVIDDLKWLARVAGENKEAKEIAGRTIAYLQRLSGFAQKPFEAPKNLKAGNNQNGQQGGEDRVAQRERDLNIREYRSAHGQVAQQMFATELAKHTAGRNVSQEQKTAIIELVTNALTRAETAEDKKKIDRYFAANDKAGYLQFKRSILDRSLSSAVERAVAVTIGRKPGPGAKGGGQGQRQGQQQQGGKQQPQAAQGWKQVAQSPHQNDIDWARTRQHGSVLEGRYILRDGSRVQHRG